MPGHSSEITLAQARTMVLAWMRAQPGNALNNEELAQSFCAQLPVDVELEMRTSYNPSALVYEVRWYHRGREVEEFPKPFFAETRGDAQLLACAAMVALPDDGPAR